MKMNSIMNWNVMGINSANKKNEIKLLCNEKQERLIDLLKSKIKFEKMNTVASKIFGG